MQKSCINRRNLLIINTLNCINIFMALNAERDGIKRTVSCHVTHRFMPCNPPFHAMSFSVAYECIIIP